MPTYKENLSKMLRAVRLACGYTQASVAAALGVTRSAYTCYETGKTCPDLDALRILASVFGIPPESFLYPERWLAPSPRARAPKKSHPNPNAIGQLTPEEKALIACRRARKKDEGRPEGRPSKEEVRS